MEGERGREREREREKKKEVAKNCARKNGLIFCWHNNKGLVL